MPCSYCGTGDPTASVKLPESFGGLSRGSDVYLCRKCLFNYVSSFGLGHTCYTCGEVTYGMYCEGCATSTECSYCGDDSSEVMCESCISHDSCHDDCGTTCEMSDCYEGAVYCSGHAGCEECGDIDENVCKNCRRCDKCGSAKACVACNDDAPIEFVNGEAQVGDVIVRFQN